MKPPIQKPELAKAILTAGLLCGAMDITAALIVYGHYGIPPLRLLRGVGAGLLGPQAYTGGVPTALFGLLCHFVIAFGAATTYALASRGIPLLIRHAISSGVLYGVAVYFFMNRIVVPLSRATHARFSLKFMIIGVVIHIFCVGLPISLATRHSESK